jgi:hypothetical protein
MKSNNNNNFAFSSHQFEEGWGGGIFNSDANEIIFKWLKKVRPSIAL